MEESFPLIFIFFKMVKTINQISFDDFSGSLHLLQGFSIMFSGGDRDVRIWQVGAYDGIHSVETLE